MGASTPELDEIVEVCLRSGSYGAKLTGAGGGGSVIAVAGEDMVAKVSAALKEKGFRPFVSSIPCDGVRAWREDG